MFVHAVRYQQNAGSLKFLTHNPYYRTKQFNQNICGGKGQGMKYSTRSLFSWDVIIPLGTQYEVLIIKRG